MRRASSKVYSFLGVDFRGIVVVVVFVWQDLSVLVAESTAGRNSSLLLWILVLAAMTTSDDTVLERCRGGEVRWWHRQERDDGRAMDDDAEKENAGCNALMMTMAVVMVE